MFDRAIKTLQEDLRTLGFLLVGEPDGANGPRLRQALLEFQIVASQPWVAQEALPGSPQAASQRYVERLNSAVNTTFNPPAVTGEHDDLTKAAIAHWLNANQRYRCPYVFEARAVGKDIKTPEFDPALANVWAYDEKGFVTASKRLVAKKFNEKFFTFEVRLCAFDQAAPPDTRWDRMTSIGRRAPYAKYYGGMYRTESPPELTAECLPIVMGKEWALLKDHEKAVFRVIRTVAEQECVGYFDALNSYDKAVLSLGPCHWTLALGAVEGQPNQAQAGELPATLAFAIGRFPALAQAFERYNITPTHAWPKTEAGKPYSLGWNGTRTYTGGLKWKHNGAKIGTLAEVEWFRTPRWFWRFKNLARAEKDFRRAQWDMARMRLRDLLTKKIGGTGTYADFTAGQIFTSELSVALLLRLHIKFAGIFSRTNEKSLDKMLKLSGLTKPVAQWKQAEEDILIKTLKAWGVRHSYPLSDIPSKIAKAPALDELTAYGSKIKPDKRKDIHKDFVNQADWPDPGVFARRHYQLEAGARVALSTVRKSFETPLTELVKDTTLPPPPPAP